MSRRAVSLGDAGAVSMAVLAGVCAWGGTWAGRARPAPPGTTAALATLGSTPAVLTAGILVVVSLVWRRPVLLIIGVCAAAAVLGVRAERGLRPPVVGPFEGVVTLVSDPVEVAGAVRVEVRLHDRRVEAWARGRSAARLAPRLAGERVILAGDVGQVPRAARARLRARHVAARLSVAEVGGWGWGNPPSRLANQVRRKLVEGAESLPSDRRALLTGFVLGDDRGQPPEVVDDFRAAGLSHLLAVSGQNVAFVLALAAPVLSRCRLAWRLALGLALLGLFGVVTRWEPSVIRAVVMAGLSLLAFTLGRPASSIRVLALAVAALVLVDPLLVHSVGFLLSVGACAGIALLAVPITARVPGPRALASALGVTLAAQVGVAPVLVPVFGGVPLASLPANLLAVPPAGPLMMWGLAAGGLAGLLGGTAARLLHVPSALALAWEAGVARWAAALPLGEVGAAGLALVALAVALRVAASRTAARSEVGGHGFLSGGSVLMATAAATAVILPAVRSLAPAPLDGQVVAEGAEVWRRGAATVLVVDGAPGPGRLLTGLRRWGIRRPSVVVVVSGRRRTADAVEPLLRRSPPALLLAPSRVLLEAATVPAGDSRVSVGSLVLRVAPAGSQLAVSVAVRGP